MDYILQYVIIMLLELGLNAVRKPSPTETINWVGQIRGLWCSHLIIIDDEDIVRTRSDLMRPVYMSVTWHEFFLPPAFANAKTKEKPGRGTGVEKLVLRSSPCLGTRSSPSDSLVLVREDVRAHPPLARENSGDCCGRPQAIYWRILQNPTRSFWYTYYNTIIPFLSHSPFSVCHSRTHSRLRFSNSRLYGKIIVIIIVFVVIAAVLISVIIIIVVVVVIFVIINLVSVTDAYPGCTVKKKSISFKFFISIVINQGFSLKISGTCEKKSSLFPPL